VISIRKKKISARGAFLGCQAKFVLNTMNFIKISLSKRDEIYFCCCQEFYLGNTLLLRLYKKMAPLSIYEKWCIQ